MMDFLYITNDPNEAAVAVSSGVNRIFIDTETLGKAERQRGMDTVKSTHALTDCLAMREKLGHSAEILVRINPINVKTRDEVETAIDSGADFIMLPMFYTVKEVDKVVKLIRGRIKFIPLVETREAMSLLAEVLCIEGIDEIYVGLNDLSISLGLSFLFEPLACGILDQMAEQINAYGLPWGFGGIARVGGGAVPAQMIALEHIRLGSSRVILSRQFKRQDAEVGYSLNAELERLRLIFDKAGHLATSEIEENRKNIANMIFEICSNIKEKSGQ